MIRKLLSRFRRKPKRGVVYVTYRSKGFLIMPETTTIKVPLASTGLVAIATFELTEAFGDLEPTDAQEAIAYGTGGLFTHTINPDNTVSFAAAASTTEGQTDTATLTDDGESTTFTLVATADSVTGEALEGVTYSHATPADVAATAGAAAGTAGAGTGGTAGGAAS